MHRLEINTDCQPHPTVYRRWLSFSGHHCSRLEQSAWSCHFRTFCSCLPVPAQNLPVRLFNSSYPSPCDCTVPVQWRLVALDTIIVLPSLLTYRGISKRVISINQGFRESAYWMVCMSWVSFCCLFIVRITQESINWSFCSLWLSQAQSGWW